MKAVNQLECVSNEMYSDSCEGCNIQVGEDDVNSQDELAQDGGHERGEEGRQEERNRHGGL